MGQTIMYIIPGFGILALLYTLWKSSWVNKQDAGTDKMKEIAAHISNGAMAFLKAEYRILFFFVLTVAVLLFFSGFKICLYCPKIMQIKTLDQIN